MGERIHHDLVAGETLALELRFPFEDLTGAVASVETTISPSSGFVATVDGTDTVFLRNVSTDVLPVGTWPVLVWLTWPSGDVLDEMLAEISLVIRRPVA